MSAPRSFAARKKLRPIRPNPLMPTLIVMGILPRAWGRTHASDSLPDRFRRSAAIDVSVHDHDGESVVPEVRTEGLCHDHRAMMAARAPDRDGEVGLPLGDEAGHGRVEEGGDAFDERAVRVL